MRAHRFDIGQSVTLASRFGLSPKAPDSYRIIARLPARDNSPQYRIRNDDEKHERVATEDNLEAFAVVATAASVVRD